MLHRYNLRVPARSLDLTVIATTNVLLSGFTKEKRCKTYLFSFQENQANAFPPKSGLNCECERLNATQAFDFC